MFAQEDGGSVGFSGLVRAPPRLSRSAHWGITPNRHSDAYPGEEGEMEAIEGETDASAGTFAFLEAREEAFALGAEACEAETS